MQIFLIWSMLPYFTSLKINHKHLTYTKVDFSIIMEKMENWIGRSVHGPLQPPSIVAINNFRKTKWKKMDREDRFRSWWKQQTSKQCVRKSGNNSFN